MSDFILIHGAWHGAWCWKKVIPLLESRQHTVTAPDLPGAGDDRITDPASVTLQTCVDFIEQCVRKRPGKVVLVGHSFAGAIISEVAERLPEKIEHLIYVCAFYMQNGESVFDVVAKYPKSNHLEFDYSENRKVWSVKEEFIQSAFYNLCSEEDATFATQSMRAQAIEPLATKIQISEANYGRVPKTYIECTLDKGTPIEAQRMMIEAQPCKVYTLETDHSPFFSCPNDLADALHRSVLN